MEPARMSLSLRIIIVIAAIIQLAIVSEAVMTLIPGERTFNRLEKAISGSVNADTQVKALAQLTAISSPTRNRCPQVSATLSESFRQKATANEDFGRSGAFAFSSIVYPGRFSSSTDDAELMKTISECRTLNPDMFIRPISHQAVTAYGDNTVSIAQGVIDTMPDYLKTSPDEGQ